MTSPVFLEHYFFKPNKEQRIKLDKLCRKYELEFNHIKRLKLSIEIEELAEKYQDIYLKYNQKFYGKEN